MADTLLIPIRDKTKRIVARAVVDKTDAALASRRWHLHNGYATCSGDAPRRIPQFMHRMVLGLTRGDGWHTDHINHDKLDNRRCNLRAVTPSVNLHNQKGPHRDSKSGTLGVSALGHKWTAQIVIDGKKRHLGLFKTKAEASDAYWAKKRELGLVPSMAAKAVA